MTHQLLVALLRHETRPLSVYEFLAALQTDRSRLAALQTDRSRLAAQTIYRVLKRLIELGCAHRLESLNAYTACRGDRHSTTAVFTICKTCGVVAEHVYTRVVDSLRLVGAATGFVAERPVIELHGTCAGCREARGAERRFA